MDSIFRLKSTYLNNFRSNFIGPRTKFLKSTIRILSMYHTDVSTTSWRNHLWKKSSSHKKEENPYFRLCKDTRWIPILKKERLTLKTIVTLISNINNFEHQQNLRVILAGYFSYNTFEKKQQAWKMTWKIWTTWSRQELGAVRYYDNFRKAEVGSSF